jgi:hypothetical protein
MKEQRVQIKFPTFAEDEELDIISKSIDCRIFLPEETLEKFIFKLRKIDSSLCKNSSSLYQTIEKKKELVESLSNKCESLKQRNAVISFAEEAEDIANSSPLLSDENVNELIADLKARIQTYVEETRPSRTNMKFLRFAEKLLEKAAKHEPVLIKSNKKENIIKFKENVPAEISLEDFALAESLYELAAILYQESEDAFNSSLENNFSESNRKEISFHISICNGFLGKLKTKEDKNKVIQGILGYAHTLTDYYAAVTPYPSLDEIDGMFSEQIY